MSGGWRDDCPAELSAEHVSALLSTALTESANGPVSAASNQWAERLEQPADRVNSAAIAPRNACVIAGAFSGADEPIGPIGDIALFCQADRKCRGCTNNQQAKNLNRSTAIRAIFRWCDSSGVSRTRACRFAPGEAKTVSRGNCGAVSVIGARYTD